MANDKVRFVPIRGLESQVLSQPKTNGQVYFTKDTGKIYLDISNTERILIGNSGISIFYTNEANVRENPDTKAGYILTLTEIENYENCHVDDLILNQADGSFYRIDEIIDEDVYSTRLSISGGGSGEGGGGSLARSMSLKAVQEVVHGSIINGQKANAIVTVKSDTDDYGEPNAEKIAVQWNLYVSGSTVPYMSGSFVADHDVPFTFEYGTRLRENTTSDVKFSATDSNGKVYTKGFTVSTIELTLTESTTFSKTSLHNPTTDFKLACNVKGLIQKKLIFEVDGEIVDEQVLSTTTVGTIQSKAIALKHGSHSAKITLYSYDNNIQGEGPKPLEFEFAYVEPGNTEAIIWLGSYQSVYYSYDKIQIPYLAYDPQSPTSAAVTFYKGSSLLESKSTSIDWSSGSVSFHLFEITDATVDAQNLYAIMCGSAPPKNIVFECQTDPDRDMNVRTDGLLVKFDASGRSNNESSVNREIWQWQYESATNPENNKLYKGTFTGFNWYNNGWVLDENNNTCLRISNGASFKVDLGNMDINTSTEGKKACTFEFEFKIKNIQNYSKVIKEITRYKATTPNGREVNDNAAYEAFMAQTKYDNYDSFLNATYDGTLSNLQYYIDESISYDDLTITSVTKIKNPDVAFAKYFKNNGFCLGSQDGFFYDGTDTVNVKYVEDQLVNLSIVFDYEAGIIIFYLNGVMSSVSKITPTGIINLDGQTLEFNSNVCDIDLYKFRVYNKALDVKAVDINYAVDHRDVLLYDQANNLAIPNTALGGEYQLKYDQMIKYNEDHPNDYLMPYLIIDTTNATAENGGLGAGVLPYRKSKKTKGVHVTFVNTGLEYAYNNGELGLLAQQAGYIDEKDGLSAIQQYYMHHCPSWTSYWPTTDDGATSDIAQANPQDSSAVTLQVQGTSSEFYPRRNYKIKLKGEDKDGEDLIYMFMNKGPFAEMYLKDPTFAQLEYFYYDNNTVGVNTFTLKVDFMESSGTYNMGFANFVKNAYTKHPLHDYNKAKAFQTVASEDYVQAIAYEEGKKYYVEVFGEYEKADEQPTADTFANGTYYTKETTYADYQFEKLEDYRTSVQGFPVIAFHKNGDNYTFIGLYRMLSDKGSDEVYGFKPNKKILAKYLDNEKVRDMVECWEFSDNSRTWCSYNDPLNRNELSFSYPDSSVEGGEKLNEPEGGGVGGAPYVANSFEYRYNTNEDVLDYLYAPDTFSSDEVEELQADYEDYILTDQADRNKLFFKIYGNWETACKWLYSTKTDNQPSQNAFSIASGVTEENFGEQTYYIKTDEVQYEIATGAFDPAEYYYERIEEENEDILDEEGKPTITVFYEYVADLTEEEYKNGTYYIQNTTGYKIAIEFNSGETYYVADFSYQDEKYLLSSPVTYGNTTYKYDTYEYRLAKFKNELSKHFDLEYCLVYFVMTEIFMCYDSRGKNCMMASWGPLEEGGDYIWYPIFYDIDTQLGINNTGIPSFEYYINATAEGSYSTNDSVLWMNLYRAFFPEIRAKYYSMRGANGGIVNVHTGKTTTPLKGAASTSINENLDDLAGTVQHIEKWYLADPNECNSISMRGDRPLIISNLDQYYKYISITNPLIGYQDREGGYITDNGTYFYALQGNRSLSRQQFLSNRINFADSWLNYGEYARGGSAIFGRIGANNAKDTNGNKIYSDYWLNTDDETLIGTAVPGNEELTYNSYYDSTGKKAEYLDADVTVKLAPYQNSYVAIGGDNGISASKQYNGTAIELELPSSVVEGRLNSPRYGEQLFYIYGTKSLQDIGDMSTLYWTEFYASKSPRLKRILLGSNYPGFFNKNMNYPNFDADVNSSFGKPLLEEVNLDNIQITDTAGKFTFDFSSSEKMKRFEALRSNVTEITFAPGVALNTLYLPETVTTLKLVEARQLEGLIKTEPMPTSVEEFKTWDTDEHKGLYIEGLTNLIDTEISSTQYSNISTYYLAGGNLGYGSYQMLETLYKLKNTAAANSNYADKLAISLTDVNWNPYTKLVEGDAVDENYNYYIDNRHYGLESYTFENSDAWNKYILDGRLYKILKTAILPQTISSIDLLNNLAISDQFSNTNSTGDTDIPIVTGTIYINNTTDTYEESNIRNGLLEYYPNLTIFFNNITQSRSANFISIDDETGAETIVGTQKVSLDSSETWFTKDPYKEYSVFKNHWVFLGWSTEAGNADKIISQNDWSSQTFTDGVIDYNFYAIFEHEAYTVNFYDGDGNIFDTQTVIYGEFATEPAKIPQKTYSAEEEAENIYGGYAFKHYTLNPNSSSKITLSSYPITTETNFYSVFTKIEDLREYVNYDYFDFIEYSYEENKYGDSSYNESGYKVVPKDGIVLQGKVTIPKAYEGKNVVAIGEFYDQEITHLFFETGSTVKEISSYTFCESNQTNAKKCLTLIYFDFIDSIRQIGASAFRQIPLSSMTNIVLPAKLHTVMERAFLQAFKTLIPITITIGSEVQVIDFYAFANNYSIPASQNTIIIGSETNKSKLDLSMAFSNDNDGYKRIFSTAFTTINFYTDLYTSINDTITWKTVERTLTECLDAYGTALQIIS